MNITIDKVTGFICKEPSVCVYDSKGDVFYIMKDKLRPIYFNLPAGTYQTEANLLVVPKRQYKLVSLPRKERNEPAPDIIRTVVKQIPNKLAVIRDTINGKQVWTIVISPAFNRNTVSKMFGVAHEIGHKWYGGFDPVTQYDKYIRSECYCDHFAVNYCLRNGLNPSQLNTNEKLTLSHSDGAKKRKEYIYNILQRVK